MKKVKDFVKNNKGQVIYLLAFSTLYIIAVSKNSFIYYFNNWVDVNCFYTVGTGWLHGIIPYRDIFEHKGPVLYLFYAIASILGQTNYVGSLLLEIFSLFSILVMFYRLATNYIGKYASLWSALIFSVFLSMSPFFQSGGGVEELSLPYVFFAITLIFYYDRHTLNFSPILGIISGVCMALLFWMKFTMIGGWLGLLVALAVVAMLDKKIKEYLKFIFWFVVGLLIVTAPIIVYFYAVNGLKDLLYTYFYVNLKLYPSNHASIFSQLLKAAINFSTTFIKNPILYISLILSMLVVIMDKHVLKKGTSKLLYLGSFFAMGLGTFFAGKPYDYYMLVIFPYVAAPIVCFSYILFKEKKSLFDNNLTTFLVSCFTFFLLIGVNKNLNTSKFFPGNRTVSLGLKSENKEKYKPAQEVFAGIMNKKENPTLLNYGALDGGFYKAAGIQPINKYFMKPNISHDKLPEIMDEQVEIVQNQQVDFVVYRMKMNADKKKTVPKIIQDNYKLVAQHAQNNGIDFTYLLYHKKNK